jgi:hypothetical protein
LHHSPKLISINKFNITFVLTFTPAKMDSKVKAVMKYKRVCPSKNEPRQQGISYLEREKEGRKREGGRLKERGAGRWAGRSAGSHV